MNIQFGKIKNNIREIKKVYNKGKIITARPQSAKYPYRILSIREFPSPIPNNKSNNNRFFQKNKYFIKSFSFVENSKRNINRKQVKKNKNYFNHSSFENNYKLKNNIKKEESTDKKIMTIFSPNPKRRNLTSIENVYNEIILKKNRQLTKTLEGNKKKVSSYSMNKYIEKYLDKEILNSKKYLNTNYNNNYDINTDLYKINYDDNTQIINFLSQVVNTDNFKKYYNTTNNILTNFQKNKIKNSTRNLIIRSNYTNNINFDSFSDIKNENDELKPLIINFKQTKNNQVKNQRNIFLKYHKKTENQTKLNTNKSSKITTQTDSNIAIKKSISIEGDKKILLIKNIKKERNEDDINNNKENKHKKFTFRIKHNNKKKRKFRFTREIKIKSKKIKIFHNNVINNEFFQYSKDIKNKMNIYKNKEKIKYEKNSDIYDYLISPQNSEGITN